MAKKFDIKQSLINHGEKIVFGIVVLVGLYGVVQTDWSPFKRAPREVAEKISSGKQKLVGKTWPAEELEKYKIEGDKIPKVIVENELFAPLNIAQYQFSNKFLRVLGANRDPVTEPVLKAPEDIIVTAARVFIEKPALPPELESKDGKGQLASAADSTTKPDDDVDDEFAVRGPGVGAGAMAGGAGGLAGYEGDSFYAPELMGGYDGGYGGGMPGYPGGGGGYPGGAGGGYPGDAAGALAGAAGYPGSYEGGYPGGGMAQTVKLNGQGYHYASVRAIFPLREQIKAYADAIHRSYSEASRTFQIIDFVLERQAKLPGDDPWSGPWEAVDIKVAQDVLDSCAYLEPEVVNSMITDTVVTMPLPSRISGRWKTHATHPRIEKFSLSEKEIELEMELNRKLLKQFLDQKKTETQGLVRKGGFSTQMYDPKAVQSALIGGTGSMYMGGYEGGMTGYPGGGGGMTGYPGGGGGYPGAAGGYGAAAGGYGAGRNNRTTTVPGKEEDPGEKLMKLLQEEIKSETKNNPKLQKEKEDALRSWITKRVSAAGDLLLFRYIDFDVEPGKTYRYRVKFVLNNPNFNRRISEAGGLAHVVEGATRETPWSEPSAPVHVEDALAYFITNVSQKSGRVLPSVSMDMFQYDTTFGTYMNSTVDVQMGQTIGGNEVTEVIKPAEQKAEKEKYLFVSDDYLVDVMADFNIDPDYHAGDKVDAATRLKLRGRKLAVPGVALVDTGDDGLSMFDGTSRADQYKANKDKITKQAEQFKAIKDMASRMAGGGAAGMMGYPGYGGYEGGGAYEDSGLMGMYGMGGMGGGGRNVNRKAKVTRGASGQFIRRGGAGGMEGGYGPGGP